MASATCSAVWLSGLFWEAHMRFVMAPRMGAYHPSAYRPKLEPDSALVEKLLLKAPVWMFVTLMPSGLSSMRSASPHACTAALDAQYAPAKGVVTVALTEPTMRMRPPRPWGFAMNGTAACTVLITPRTLVSMTDLISSSGCSASGPKVAPPALQITASIAPPPSLAALSMASFSEASLVTSSASASAATPCSCRSDTAAIFLAVATTAMSGLLASA
mmetsp:Transcript_17393/g.52475  ORF Transcript_17393/g.52475 Transcript_17393/m.52475 type:complete len:217 (+) Transcript_17393:451-1101(+)